MARRLDEEQTAVNTGILDVAVTLSGKLLAEVCGVLILDIFHDGVPASSTLARETMLRVGGCLIPSVVVDLVTVSRSVNNVETQTHAVLLND